MSDTSAVREAVMYAVPITKGKATIDIDLSVLPDNMYMAAVREGVKVLVNSPDAKDLHKGMGGVTAATFPDETERKAAAMEIAASRIEAMLAGKLKIKGERAAAGPSGAVMTEARRLGRIIIKDAMREKGMKISQYSASEITACANDLIKNDPSLIDQATKNLASRGKLEEAVTVDLAGLKPDPKKVAADEAAKKAKADKPPLSALQAGKVAPHASHAGA